MDQPKYVLKIYDDDTGELRQIVTEVDDVEVQIDENLGPVSAKLKVYKTIKDLVINDTYKSDNARVVIDSVINGKAVGLFAGFVEKKKIKDLKKNEGELYCFGYPYRIEKLLHRSSGSNDYSNNEVYSFDIEGGVSDNIRHVIKSLRGVHSTNIARDFDTGSFSWPTMNTSDPVGGLKVVAGSFSLSTAQKINRVTIEKQTSSATILSSTNTYNTEYPAVRVYAEIQTDDGAGAPSGEVLASAYTYPWGRDDVPRKLVNITWYFDDIELDASTTYHLVISAPDTNVGMYHWWSTSSGLGEYLNISSDGGATWSTSTGPSFNSIQVTYTDDSVFPLSIDEDNFEVVPTYQVVKFGNPHTGLDAIKEIVKGLSDDYHLNFTADHKVQLKSNGNTLTTLDAIDDVNNWTFYNCSATEESGEPYDVKYGSKSFEITLDFLDGAGRAYMEKTLANPIDIRKLRYLGFKWFLPYYNISLEGIGSTPLRIYMYLYSSGGAYTVWTIPVNEFGLKYGFSTEQDNWNDTLKYFDLYKAPSGTGSGGVDFSAVETVRFDFGSNFLGISGQIFRVDQLAAASFKRFDLVEGKHCKMQYSENTSETYNAMLAEAVNETDISQDSAYLELATGKPVYETYQKTRFSNSLSLIDDFVTPSLSKYSDVQKDVTLDIFRNDDFNIDELNCGDIVTIKNDEFGIVKGERIIKRIKHKGTHLQCDIDRVQNTAYDDQVLLFTKQNASIKEVSRSVIENIHYDFDGWNYLSKPTTWTLDSATDAPYYVLEADRKVSNILKKGMFCEFVQNNELKFGIINYVDTAVQNQIGVFMGNTSFEGQTILDTSTYPITGFAYSLVKSAYGFPGENVMRWTLQNRWTGGSNSQSSPVALTWYNKGPTLVVVPGDWYLGYRVHILSGYTGTGYNSILMTLSDANNTESDRQYTTDLELLTSTNETTDNRDVEQTERYEEVLTKKTKYVNIATASTGMSYIQVRAVNSDSIVWARSAHI